VRVLFLLYGPFDSNSAIQALHFGNHMTDIGCEVTLCATGDPGKIGTVGHPRFECIRYPELSRKRRQLQRNSGDALICAWTPRERVRKATEKLLRHLPVPYVVHLEDNESYLLSSFNRLPKGEMRRMPVRRYDRPSSEEMVDPARYLEFLRSADGITVITEELNDFNVGHRPHHLARPGIDSDRFRPDLTPPLPRERLGLSRDDFVLVYHGTTHFANQHEMLSLYLAVKLLRRRGLPVRLVRLGVTNLGGVDPRSFGALMDDVIELGKVPWREIPSYLALADAFVQPGAPNDFNRYRLPSKLPEFLAMGRPVILPHCNIGNDLTDGVNALLLEQGTAPEIATRIERLIADPALADRLARGAREFALQQLSWHDNAMGLLNFYRGVVAARRDHPTVPTAPQRAA
jgi:glycosyltransferase involved in cell wall biosynthesis